MVAVLALTACAVLAGATSLLAVGEWIAGAPPSVLEHLGVRPDPLCPKRYLPAETTVRRLLGRIDGDALDQAVGRWLADRRYRSAGAGPVPRRDPARWAGRPGRSQRVPLRGWWRRGSRRSAVCAWCPGVRLRRRRCGRWWRQSGAGGWGRRRWTAES
ncbi:transposase family protein [Streptomyces sp. M1013]|uniref:transposase family protein n=1 Tax=Streptomyces sp. M1013 TaxID=549798 RepID=UPI00209BA096|nr:transposase family protein [Streptomyces sp. M1013]